MEDRYFISTGYLSEASRYDHSDKTVLTEQNIKDHLINVPSDMEDDVYPGCIVHYVHWKGSRMIIRWPDGRVAIIEGHHDVSFGLLQPCEELVRMDDDTLVDLDGFPVVDDAENDDDDDEEDEDDNG